MYQKVVVLMATYNGEKYLSQQIDSIISQQNVDLKLYISDDGSQDKTVAIIKNEYPSVPLNINIPGSGSAANNFLGMIEKLNFQEKFDYVAFSDQDDVWHPEKMEAAIDLILKNDADLYCSNLTKWDEGANTFIELKKDFAQKKFDYLFEGGSAGCTYVFTYDFAVSLQRFLKILDTKKWSNFSHDWLVYFFARSRKFKVVFDPNSYINYRLHDANVHGHLNKLSWNTIKTKSTEVFKGYYQHQIKHFNNYLDKDSEEFQIYKNFSAGYFRRNFTILKYNTQLMRDKKKFIIFMALNLLKF